MVVVESVLMVLVLFLYRGMTPVHTTFHLWRKRWWFCAKMPSPTLIQVTNVSPHATPQQMKELFSYLGDIVEIKVYPER